MRLPDDLGMRLLALVIAVALWFVANGDTRSRRPEVEERVLAGTVRLENIERDLVAMGSVGSVEVRLRVPAGTVLPEQLTAQVDLRGRRAGEHRVPVVVNPPVRTNVVSVSPERVTVVLERRLTQNFAVEVAVLGLPVGVSVMVGQPDPAEVTLVGAESQIKKVSRVLALATFPAEETEIEASVRAVDAAGVDVPGVVVTPREVTVLLREPMETPLHGDTEEATNEQPVPEHG